MRRVFWLLSLSRRSCSRPLLVGLLTVAASLVFASGAWASGPLIVGNNAAFGNGPIQTYDFSGGGSPVASFVPSGASGGGSNGRGVEVIGSEVFYTELSSGFGPTDAIRVAPYNGGAGGSDSRTIPNPNPFVGIQDLSASGGALYALTGYLSSALRVFKLDPTSGAVLAGPISISAPASPQADGFVALPNGNFLVNNSTASCTYNQYDGSTGALVSGTTITVPGASSCTGVDTDGTSLFFATNHAGFTQTDLSGKLVAHQTTTRNSVEDISLIHQVDDDLALTDMPPDTTVDATSPAGALVTYDPPKAIDEDLSTVTVACSPAPGSTFAIGPTKVTCTATDTDGDKSSPVSGSFIITVRGAADQLTDLCAASEGVGPGRSLANKCAAAQTALAAGQASDARDILAGYSNEVSAQSGKKIPAATAAKLIGTARQISAVIGP